MKIFAMINNSVESCQFSSIEISAKLKTWNQWRISLKGALSRKSQPQGSLEIYILGKVAIIEGKGNVTVRESLDSNTQYSILSVPYWISSSESYQVNILLELEEPHLQEKEPLASVYLGDKRVSKDLISSNIWENLIQIKSLKFQLIYPRIFPAGYIKPVSEKIAPSTEEETKQILRKKFGDDILDWEIKKWLVQNVHKNTPFILGFPDLDEIIQDEIDKREEEKLKNKTSNEKKKGCLSFLINPVTILVAIILSLSL